MQPTNNTHLTKQLKNITNMETTLKNYAGITARIQTIFDYHYDAILRDIQAEVQNIPEADKWAFIDHFTTVMEDGYPIQPEQLTKIIKA